MSVKILSTGGTIDGYIDPDEQDKAFQSSIPQLLENARVNFSYTIESVFAKDSRAITEQDRKKLLTACEQSDEETILITHGTDTMSETAKYLGAAKLSKTIVLVGAMTPAEQDNSDAEFNLGAAIMALLLQPHGVYVVMNGQLFHWDNVQKNKELKRFETIE